MNAGNRFLMQLLFFMLLAFLMLLAVTTHTYATIRSYATSLSYATPPKKYSTSYATLGLKKEAPVAGMKAGKCFLMLVPVWLPFETKKML